MKSTKPRHLSSSSIKHFDVKFLAILTGARILGLYEFYAKQRICSRAEEKNRGEKECITKTESVSVMVFVTTKKHCHLVCVPLSWRLLSISGPLFPFGMYDL